MCHRDRCERKFQSRRAPGRGGRSAPAVSPSSGTGQFLEGLDRFVDSLNGDARLNDIGRFIAEERILLHVVNRLQLRARPRATTPRSPQVEIVKPVFIIGLPRTGTTILHDILNQDPANRAPLTWELMFPSPPPEAAVGNDDPARRACARRRSRSATCSPTMFKAMHPMGATLSQECVVMMGEAMCTPLFHNQFRVPDLPGLGRQRSRLVGASTSSTAASSSTCGGTSRGDRWMLKTGAHMWGLAQLLETYPDARIVFTHRDPVKSMTSYASLTALVRVAWEATRSTRSRSPRTGPPD